MEKYILKGLAWDDKPENYLDQVVDQLKNLNIYLVIVKSSYEFEQRLKNEQGWDFIVMDVVEEFDDGSVDAFAGFNNALEARKQYPNIPVFFVTSDNNAALRSSIRLPPPTFTFSKLHQPRWFTTDIVDILQLLGLLQKEKDKHKVFINRGISSQWQVLKKLLTEDFKLSVEVAKVNQYGNIQGISQLIDQINSCGLAILAITKDMANNVKDDTHKYYQGQYLNFVHVLGLAQGMLGKDNTILMVEKEVKLPTNLEQTEKAYLMQNESDFKELLEIVLKRRGIIS